MITPVVARANELRVAKGRPLIRAHVTPHTFRRTYITYMIAAGYDLPYVQAQVGHDDPGVTLSIYAQVMRRADRAELRAEIRTLLGVRPEPRGPRAGAASDRSYRRADESGPGGRFARDCPRDREMSVARQAAASVNGLICRTIASTPNRIRTGDLLRERQAS